MAFAAARLCMTVILWSFLQRGTRVQATTIHVVNAGRETVCARYWVPNEVGGGCKELGAGQGWNMAASPRWRAATVWAARGGCGHVASCNTGPPSGVTQFEITVAGGYNNDYYDVSMLAGFNLGVKVAPSNPACPAQDCSFPAACQGFVPGGPDRTKACRYGSTDYTVVFSS